MGRKPIEKLYKKVTIGVSLDKWVIEYFRDNDINLSKTVNKLLKEHINAQNEQK